MDPEELARLERERLARVRMEALGLVPAATAGPRVPTLGDLYARPSSDESAAIAGPTAGIAPPPAEAPYEMSPEEAAFLADEPAPAPEIDWAGLLAEGVADREARDRDIEALREEERLRGLLEENRGHLEDLYSAVEDPSALAGPDAPVSDAMPSFSEEEARANGWRPPEEGGPVPGSVYDTTRDPLTEATGTPPGEPRPTGTRRRSSGGVAAPDVAPAVAPGEALVDLLTDRPSGSDPLHAPPGAGPDLAYESPLDRDLRLNEARRRLAIRSAETAGMALRDERDALHGAELARQENEDQRRAAMGEARERYRRAVDNARSMTIDPEGWYHDRGVGGTITAALAIGMGAFGSGLTGGSNQALDIINDSIDRDLEAQAQAIDSAWRGADAEGNLLDLLSQEFDSREAALAAARAAMLEEVANEAAERAAALSGDEAGLAAAEMAAQLRDQAAAAAAEAEARAFDDAIARRTAIAEMTQAEAEALRAARRAGGAGAASGGGGVALGLSPTDMTAYNRYRGSGYDHAMAAEAMGLNPTTFPEPAGGLFAVSDEPEGASDVAALDRAEAELSSMLSSAENEGDIPGVGVFDELLPDRALRMVGSAGPEIRTRIRNIADLLIRMRTGAAAPATEIDRIAGLLTGDGTEAALREGLAVIRSEVDARRTRLREGVSATDRLDASTSAVGGTVVSP